MKLRKVKFMSFFRKCQKKKNNTNDIFNSLIKQDEEYISWKHCFYKIYFNLRRLFINPKSHKDLDLMQQVETLLNSCPIEEGPNENLIDKCHHFIQLHRITENTSARKRLEKWATRVIVGYLFIVLSIVVLTGIRPLENYFDLDEKIIITLLSTTTVTIIGLGLIVLRGHFYSNNEELFNKFKQEIKEELKKENQE